MIPFSLLRLADKLIPKPEGFPSTSVVISDSLEFRGGLADVQFMKEFQVEIEACKRLKEDVDTLAELRRSLISYGLTDHRARAFVNAYAEALLMTYFSDKRVLKMKGLLPKSSILVGIND